MQEIYLGGVPLKKTSGEVTGKYVKIDNEDYLIMKESDIMGVL